MGRCFDFPGDKEDPMSDKTKAKVALADAIIMAMWTKGLITLEERRKITEKAAQRLQAVNC